MDFLAHALYGATLFSRTGLAGGASGRRRMHSWISDWTVWAALIFAVLPDLLSIGVEMVSALVNGRLFAYSRVPDYVLILYQLTHNLLLACALCCLFRLLWKPLFLPALAWPLHILMDLFTHGQGRWNTAPLFPLSNFTISGINWWSHPWVVAVYWSVLVLLWVGIHRWRRSARAKLGPAQTAGQ